MSEPTFRERVERNLEISNRLQKEPWLIEELDCDPDILSAVIAHHADFIEGRIIGGRQPSATREALRGLLDAELTKRSTRAQKVLAWAGFLVSFAGFALAGVQFAGIVCR
jgi:hypothetical protein